MFKNRIEYWAEKNGVKHKALAKECGVSPQTFSNWVNNKTQPDLNQAAVLARILRVSLDELVDFKEEES